jgi:hypothetical protein
MVNFKDNMRDFIEKNYNSTFLPNARITDSAEQEVFKNDLLSGFDKLYGLKDRYANEPALVMGLGPSLLNIDKEKYNSHVKITCNNFWKVPVFFEGFKPDFWCAANSYEALKESFGRCLDNDIKTFVTIPIRSEFSQLLKIAKEKDKMELVYPWMWEQRVFQVLLAQKYGVRAAYSRCNTVTNHMIAFALWLGCNPIDVTGFDLSYKDALNKTGTTHAGFTNEQMENDTILGKKELPSFDIPSERAQVISDLRYLCTVAKKSNIKINNLSFETNRLPYTLSYTISEKD